MGAAACEGATGNSIRARCQPNVLHSPAGTANPAWSEAPQAVDAITGMQCRGFA